MKKKLRGLSMTIVALAAIIIASSFTEGDEIKWDRQKANLVCPFPSLKTVEGCISGSSTCTPSGFC
jgi:hypothetical protein